ncbi:helix-turn-helix domain-containing protein [Nocardia sp. NPDC058666]|uniref:helix-turn-helix domain-containing protein n=1 Tax=Nocardia sp. NPDC058666 TaxID=3346587 RepID=UPI00364CCF85
MHMQQQQSLQCKSAIPTWCSSHLAGLNAHRMHKHRPAFTALLHDQSTTSHPLYASIPLTCYIGCMVRHRSAVVPSEVSATLRHARKARDMTMDRAARTARISASLWTQVESGVQYKRGERVEASTTAETLQAMARAVGVDPAPLLERAGLESVGASHVEDEPAENAVDPEAIVNLAGLSVDDLRTIAVYVNGFRAARGV